MTNSGQLNAWEQVNIDAAVDWLRGRRSKEPVVKPAFLSELHRRMFGNTWRWAGSFRRTEKNIGVAPQKIPEALLNLAANTTYWIDHGTYSTDEIASRFHHRLVSIHPFPNGNGRHARLSTDLLLDSLGAPPFTWGSADLNHDGGARSRYLHALREAHQGTMAELVQFVRS